MTWESRSAYDPRDVIDPFGQSIAGLPNAGTSVLSVTFDPAVRGTQSGDCSGSASYVFPVVAAALTLGDRRYAGSNAQLTTNAYLPVLGCSSLDTGLIQLDFSFTDPLITTTLGGHSYHVYAGYYEQAYVPGYLPAVPAPGPPPDPRVFAGQFGMNQIWFGGPFNSPRLLTTFTPAAVDAQVPEPSSVVLLGIGLIAVAHRIRHAGRRVTTSPPSTTSPSPSPSSLLNAELIDRERIGSRRVDG